MALIQPVRLTLPLSKKEVTITEASASRHQLLHVTFYIYRSQFPQFPQQEQE